MAIPRSYLDELEKRRAQALEGGGADKLDDRRAKGVMSARERLTTLFDENTFLEFGLLAQHACHDFGMEKKRLPGDAVVTGLGHVDGRAVAAFSQDFTIAGGSLGKIHAGKICDVMDLALQNGLPLVAFNDSGGARIQEGVESLAGYGRVFTRNVFLSGAVPQIAVIAGPCAGGALYSPALMDFVIMVKGSASMFICGPEVIKAATGAVTTMDEIGSAAAHASISGNIHFVAESDLHAVLLVKKLLSFLPSSNAANPPHDLSSPLSPDEDAEMNEVIPENPKAAFAIQRVVERVVDDGDFFEVQSEWARNMVIGLGRIQGVVAGIVANNPAVKAGAIDIDASDKAARFIRFCNAFNVPIVTLVDVPGFLPGVAQERGGIIRHGAKMLSAYATATVPKITLILRKAYGGAYLAMCSRDLGADMVFAWPTAEIAVMGADGAVKILYKREIAAADDPKKREAELSREYRDKFTSPYQAAGAAIITDVIDPARTRVVLATALRHTLTKRENRPAKKHDNIPL